MSVGANWVRQSAAIPLRKEKVCLVTSSSGKRWVIPKGVLEPGKTAGEIALQEAFEEAGLTGVLRTEPVGSYVYQKWGRVCYVTVFVLDVVEVLPVWPEQSLRERTWLRPETAIERIDEEGLRSILAATLNAPPTSEPTLLTSANS